MLKRLMTLFAVVECIVKLIFVNEAKELQLYFDASKSRTYYDDNGKVEINKRI